MEALCRLIAMGEWWSQNAVSATAVLISIASLLGTILYRRRSERKREFEVLLQRFERVVTNEAAIDQEAAKRQSAFETALQRFDQAVDKREAETRAFTERIDREATERNERFEREFAKREEAIQASMDRSDRKFEALLARIDELSRQLSQLVERVVTNEAGLDEVRAAVRRIVSNPASSPGLGEALAAQ